MRIPTLLLLSLPLAAPSLLPSFPQSIFSNPEESTYKIPTVRESAILGRRILHLTPLGTLSTVFPSPSKTLQNRAEGLDGLPIGLMDYIADCEGDGNPTILSIKIATTFKNTAAGSNISLSINWVPPYPPSSRISPSKSPYAYSAANQPRFSLLGQLEKIPEHEVKALKLGECFTKAHPDARYWLPGNSIHESEWVRLVVRQVYWVGGFGDRAYIGWIPVGVWNGVTEGEWAGVRLPGEKKGWKEWAVDVVGSSGWAQWEL